MSNLFDARSKLDKLLMISNLFIAMPVWWGNPSFYESPNPDKYTLSLILAAIEIKLWRTVELLHSIRRKAALITTLDDLICVHDDGDKQGQDNVDEKADEGVEIYSTVHPYRVRLFLKWDLFKKSRKKQVTTILTTKSKVPNNKK